MLVRFRRDHSEPGESLCDMVKTNTQLLQKEFNMKIRTLDEN